MNIVEARRTRQLIIRLDRGEEIPAALVRALDEVEARAGWIEGFGSLEGAQIALFDPVERSRKARRMDGLLDVATLTGSIANERGETSLRLSGTLVRETDVGLQLSAGEIVWARVHALELRVTVFDDLLLGRAPDERTTPPAVAAQPAIATPAPVEPVRAAPAARVAEPAPAAATAESMAAPMPQRPARPRQEDEQHYPDAGDAVTHFHFGECVVISSDGERIRLRQDRDGRVREVSLTMLRIEPPTIDPATGKRHFHLARKN